MKAVCLKTEQLINPIGIGVIQPILSWQCCDGIKQTAYEIKATSNGVVIWQTEKTLSSKMQVQFAVPLASKQKVKWCLRLWDENNIAGEWSESASLEAGILESAQFCAKWINPELICDVQQHKPASYLQTTFTAPKGENARLYITCHGLYEAYINNQRVGNFVLAPGSNTYDKAITYQTYDVTNLVQEGENKVQVILGDGWYRSCSGVDGDRNLYGEDIALYFQLEVDGVPVCISNENWQATQAGPLRENDMQQGEVYDANFETLTDWHSVKIEDFETDTFICSNSVPIVEKEHFTGNVFTTPNGETVIDCGQNLAGYMSFTLHAKQGETIVLTHGESLDENGNFTAENFQDRQRHKEGGTKQQVTYICKEGQNQYKSKFTIFGFRYAKVETNIDLSTAQFTAIAVYSDMQEQGAFACGNQDVNQLVHNSLWSMKSNFCDVPTDCPTRERAAWTGDMGVFINTGMYLANCYPVVRKWLAECRLNQYDDGKVANIAPKNNNPSFFTQMLAGSVGWGDACILVPYAMYQRYNDISILQENYAMMKKWFGFLQERAKQKPEQSPIAKENPFAEYTIESGVDYGEWCEPDVESTSAMREPQYKVATAYFAYSAKLMAEIASLLGDEQKAQQYAIIAQNATKAYHHVATENGKISSNRQAEYVRAIVFGLLSDTETQQAATDLNQLILQSDYHLNTGFLSTPHLCSVLAQHGYVDTAYKLLLQDTMPSWLYAVKKGATTIWENWDSINEQGEVKASLNHYSYGAICNWLFAEVCGIQVHGEKVTIKPIPHPSLHHAKASYHSPLGTIESAWKYEQDTVKYEITVPANVIATVILPTGETKIITAGKHCF